MMPRPFLSSSPAAAASWGLAYRRHADPCLDRDESCPPFYVARSPAQFWLGSPLPPCCSACVGFSLPVAWRNRRRRRSCFPGAVARRVGHRRVRRPRQGGRQGRSARPCRRLSRTATIQGGRSGQYRPDRLHARSRAIRGDASPAQGRGRCGRRRGRFCRFAGPARTRADQDENDPAVGTRPARIGPAQGEGSARAGPSGAAGCRS